MLSQDLQHLKMCVLLEELYTSVRTNGSCAPGMDGKEGQITTSLS